MPCWSTPGTRDTLDIGPVRGSASAEDSSELDAPIGERLTDHFAARALAIIRLLVYSWVTHLSNPYNLLGLAAATNLLGQGLGISLDRHPSSGSRPAP